MEGKDVIEEKIKELQSLLRDGDRLTVTAKDARLVRWGRVEALGAGVVASFLGERREKYHDTENG